MNFFDFLKKFPSESSIVKHYIQIRYKNKTPHCNHCGSVKVYHYNNESKLNSLDVPNLIKNILTLRRKVFNTQPKPLRGFILCLDSSVGRAKA